jgi:Ser/Thr protein kinase RdoA (MazF antagonist)
VKYEPPIAHARLIQIIHAEYGIIVERVSFVPVGYVAACYVAFRPTGRNLFVKIWPNTQLNSDEWTSLDASLRLTQAMHDRGLFTCLPYPILTTAGCRSSAVDGHPFALFPCLPGRVAPRWAQLSPNQRDQFARALAKIHRSTPDLSDVLPESETFAFRDEADLIDGLREIELLPRNTRPALRAARNLVLPRQ